MKTVVLLLGPSSAGKSTTCGALQNGYGWRACSIDEECEKNAKERLAFFESSIEAAGLFDELAPFMSREAVLTLCLTGKFKICKDGQEVYACRFINPDYPMLELRLTKAGLHNINRKC